MAQCIRGAFRLLHPALQDALEYMGFCSPTPIQEKSIPVVLRGSHVLITAPTGSGKTEAAVLPAVSRVLWETRGRERKGISILYITPLRSLNRDIFSRLERLLQAAGITVFLRHGDSTSSERRIFLRKSYDFVVMTPESLEYLLSSSEKFREYLAELRVVIVDELHELIASKRGAELAVVLERLEKRSRHRVQRIGVSATLGDPALAARFLAGPSRRVEIVEDPSPKKYDVRVEAPAPRPEHASIAAKMGLEPDTVARLYRILELREKYGHLLVFTNTRDTAELLSKLLDSLSPGTVRVHHGSLSREERVETERLFKEGKVPILVATSSLELGIDIGHVEYVVQYLSPRQAVKLVQRIGRSGHALGRVSKGSVLALRNFFDALESLVLAARGVRGDIEEPRPYENPLDVLAHEVAGIVDEYGEISIYEVYELVTSSYPFQSLAWDEFIEVIEALEAARIVRRAGDRLRRGSRLKKYHYSVTMIPDVKQYAVIDVAGRKIGVLDDVFVSLLEPGSEFVLAGSVWRVVEIGETRVLVEKVDAPTLRLPAWEGDLIPVEWKAAREAGSVVRRLVDGVSVETVYRVGSEDVWSVIRGVLEEQLKRGYPVPSDKSIVVEAVADIVAFLGFFGTRLAKTLEFLLSALVAETLGYTPRSSSNAYAVLLQFNSPPSREYVENLVGLLKRIEYSEAIRLVERVASRSSIYAWKLYHVAVRMGLVEKGAKPERRMLEALSGTVAGREALRELIHDKLDFAALERLLEGVKRGWIRVSIVYGRRDPSPLLLHALEIASSGDRLKSDSIPSSVLAEVLRKKLDEKKVRMVCLSCGEVFEERIGSLPDKPRCPKCGLALVAPTRLEPREARRLVEAGRRGRLRGEEAKLYRELMEAANLVLSFGKMAVYALATHGVGVSTAKRVLRELAFGEEAFFKALVEAEKRYRRTRRYWDSG